MATLGQGELIQGYILIMGLDSILPVLSTLIAMYEDGEISKGQTVFDIYISLISRPNIKNQVC